jgi:hypothetical protein
MALAAIFGVARKPHELMLHYLDADFEARFGLLPNCP